MRQPILGFTGPTAEKRALKLSRTTPPRTYVLPDGSVVGVGLTKMNYVDGMDRIDTNLHGARCTWAKMSDFERKGGALDWLAMTSVERARNLARQKKAASK